jgi:hypothetical protein
LVGELARGRRRVDAGEAEQMMALIAMYGGGPTKMMGRWEIEWDLAVDDAVAAVLA